MSATAKQPPLARLRHDFLSTPEEIIDEAKNGRMFILVDDEDRENEGDLVIPAQMATPDAINFMARHGRGLICLALSKERVEQLGLDLMSRHNGTRHETAFTVSIEARDGVTTGISAADRARTVAVAIDSSKGREHIVTPGHVFPLVGREGGVLVRTGHTEAAVDVSRLAGLNPSGVICEIMKDDGTMARMDIIAGEGRGVVVIINRPEPGMLSKVLKARSGPDTDMDELRDYGMGAQILAELGVHDMILLTNSHHTLVALEGYGLSIVGERPIPNVEAN